MPIKRTHVSGLVATKGGTLKKLIISGLLILFCVSCSSLMPKRELLDDTYVSEAPPLTVKFKKEVRSFESRNNKSIFALSSGQSVWISFERVNISPNKIDYWYPLEKIVSNFRGCYTDKVYFDNHEWAKYAWVSDNYYLATGYVTRKGQDFIDVYVFSKLTPDAIEEYKKYQKTMQLTPNSLDYIKRHFNMLDASVEILK